MKHSDFAWPRFNVFFLYKRQARNMKGGEKLFKRSFFSSTGIDKTIFVVVGEGGRIVEGLCLQTIQIAAKIEPAQHQMRMNRRGRLEERCWHRF